MRPTEIVNGEFLKSLWSVLCIPSYFGMFPFNDVYESRMYRPMVVYLTLTIGSVSGIRNWWLKGKSFIIVIDYVILNLMVSVTLIRLWRGCRSIQIVIQKICILESQISPKTPWKPNLVWLYANVLLVIFGFVLQIVTNILDNGVWFAITCIPCDTFTIFGYLFTSQVNSFLSLFDFFMRRIRKLGDHSTAVKMYHIVHAAASRVTDLYGPTLLLAFIHCFSCILLNLFINVNSIHFERFDDVYMRKFWLLSNITRILDAIYFAHILSYQVSRYHSFEI